jgi:proline dehydrogenase
MVAGPPGYHPEMPITATLRGLPERTLRTILLGLSRRRALGRLATRLPVTRGMVARFVAGETLDAAVPALERLRGAGLRTTVDELGESVTSPEAAQAAAAGYVAALDALATRGLDRNVSLKLTQMGLDIDPELCRANVERVMRRAAELGAFVRIDMEDHTRTDATLGLWRELRPINASSGDSGVVIQAALRRSADDVEQLIKEGARVRLCKGAYVEPPTVACVSKAEVDRNYVVLMERLLREGQFPAIATHDERIIRRAIELVGREGIGAERFEFQMLFGVRRDLQERLVADGFGVRVYVPYGGDWYPYFMRRLAERPANVAFLLRSVLREGRRG